MRGAIAYWPHFCQGHLICLHLVLQSEQFLSPCQSNSEVYSLQFHLPGLAKSALPMGKH